MDILGRISEELQKGEPAKVLELTKRAICKGLPAKAILDDGLVAGMDVVGGRFKAREIFLPDVLLAAKAMHAGMDELKPLFLSEEVPTLGKVVLGSVQGDLHDIGKNLVGILLRGAGFDVIDLGHDVPADEFVAAAMGEDACVIGMSALLTTTMTGMATTITLLKEKDREGRIRTIVGGAPLSEDFAREIGADAYGFDAASAVDRVRKLIGEIGS